MDAIPLFSIDGNKYSSMDIDIDTLYYEEPCRDRPFGVVVVRLVEFQREEQLKGLKLIKIGDIAYQVDDFTLRPGSYLIFTISKRG